VGVVSMSVTQGPGPAGDSRIPAGSRDLTPSQKINRSLRLQGLLGGDDSKRDLDMVHRFWVRSGFALIDSAEQDGDQELAINETLLLLIPGFKWPW
jgi:hypothetical protein